MRWMAAVVLALAALAAAQAVVTQNVDFLWLGGQWVQLPRFPGDVGVLQLSWWSSQQYVDVSVSLTPHCPWLEALEAVRLPTAGPGVFTVALRVRALALNVSCPVDVSFYARYRSAGAALTDGREELDGLRLYIPPYPTFQLSAEGTAYLDIPSNITLRVASPYRLQAQLAVAGQGAAVLQAPTAITTNATVPIAVVAQSQQAALQVTLTAKDWLGNPVTQTYAVPLAVAPLSPAVLEFSPPAVYANRLNRVSVSVRLPVEADGTAVLTVQGASTPRSSYTVEIRRGVGAAVVELYPTGGAVTFTASVTYQVAGVWVSQQLTAVATVQQPLAGVASVHVEPPSLVAGAPANLTVRVEAPGPFNASITLQGAASQVPTPYYLSGVGAASASLTVVPLSQTVTVAVQVSTDRGTEQYTASLPVTSASIFAVTAAPSTVAAGGNRTVTLRVVNLGNMPISTAIMTVSPSQQAALASTAVYRLGPLEPMQEADVPYSFVVPATYGGPLAFSYQIAYVTATGVSGTVQGQLYLQAVQAPNVTVLPPSVTPQPAATGQSFFVTLTVLNQGFTQVLNLQAQAEVPQGLRASSSPTYYVGQLAAQQLASIPLSFVAFRPGRYSVRVVVSYMDQYGNTYVLPVEVPVTVVNGTGFGGFRGTATAAGGSQPPQQWWIAAAAAAAVAVVAAALLAARRRGRRG